MLDGGPDAAPLRHHHNATILHRELPLGLEPFRASLDRLPGLRQPRMPLRSAAILRRQLVGLRLYALPPWTVGAAAGLRHATRQHHHHEQHHDHHPRSDVLRKMLLGVDLGCLADHRPESLFSRMPLPVSGGHGDRGVRDYRDALRGRRLDHHPAASAGGVLGGVLVGVGCNRHRVANRARPLFPFRRVRVPLPGTHRHCVPVHRHALPPSGINDHAPSGMLRPLPLEVERLLVGPGFESVHRRVPVSVTIGRTGGGMRDAIHRVRRRHLHQYEHQYEHQHQHQYQYEHNIHDHDHGGPLLRDLRVDVERRMDPDQQRLHTVVCRLQVTVRGRGRGAIHQYAVSGGPHHHDAAGDLRGWMWIPVRGRHLGGDPFQLRSGMRMPSASAWQLQSDVEGGLAFALYGREYDNHRVRHDYDNRSTYDHEHHHDHKHKHQYDHHQYNDIEHDLHNHYHHNNNDDESAHNQFEYELLHHLHHDNLKFDEFQHEHDHGQPQHDNHPVALRLQHLPLVVERVPMAHCVEYVSILVQLP